MKIKTIVLGLCGGSTVLVFAFAGVVLIQAATVAAASIIVTKTDDTWDGVCDTDCSLRDAIWAANENAGDDTVIVPAGTFVISADPFGCGDDDIGRRGDLDILEQVSIIGEQGAEATIIDAGGATGCHRAFDIHGPFSGVVTIQGLTITGGNLHEDGGAIRVDQARLSLDAVLLIGNLSDTGSGGAIWCLSGGEVLIQNESVVSGNQAAVYGGGIGAASCSVAVLETVVSDNDSSMAGGGLFVAASSSNHLVLVTGSSILRNQAALAAGGMFASGADTTISDSTVAYNRCWNGDGGGLVISMNTDNPTVVRNCSIFGNAASDSGGGAYISSTAAAEFTAVTFFGNISTALSSTIQNDGEASLTSSLLDGECDGAGSFISNGGNVLSGASGCGLVSGPDLVAAGDLMLSGPAMAGGSTQVLLPGPASPAVGHGSEVFCPATDQRGLDRSDGFCDAGAVERQTSESLIFADSFELGTAVFWSSSLGES